MRSNIPRVPGQVPSPRDDSRWRLWTVLLNRHPVGPTGPQATRSGLSRAMPAMIMLLAPIPTRRQVGRRRGSLPPHGHGERSRGTGEMPGLGTSSHSAARHCSQETVQQNLTELPIDHYVASKLQNRWPSVVDGPRRGLGHASRRPRRAFGHVFDKGVKQVDGTRRSVRRVKPS